MRERKILLFFISGENLHPYCRLQNRAVRTPSSEWQKCHRYLSRILYIFRKFCPSCRKYIRLNGICLHAEKHIFKRIVVTITAWGFSPDYEKRTVQVYFLVSACVDTVIQYLKENLASSIDIIREVVTETVEKPRDRNELHWLLIRILYVGQDEN